MKKRFTVIVPLLAVCLLVGAQSKLTSDALLRISQMKQHSARRAVPAEDMTTKTMRLVVKADKAPLSATATRLRAAGALIEGRLGEQLIISLPMDSIAALERIAGISRIDAGHKAWLKTDIARQETGVGKVNGPQLPAQQTAYTGKGVTVCIADVGIDFQHPAFKDSEGRSRIKAVYMMNDSQGRKFSYTDPEVGEITLPGSVYDTPELIAALTTDTPDETHGTHTVGIAAGTLSPQGFGGMAPEADIVLIPITDDTSTAFDDEYETFEYALAFATAYARQSGQPMVLSVSAASHDGPHNGTGTIPEAISAASKDLIPVFAAGNEGATEDGVGAHIYYTFTEKDKEFKTILAAITESGDKSEPYLYMAEESAYTRQGNQAAMWFTLCTLNQMNGRLTTRWTSDTVDIRLGDDSALFILESKDNADLAKYFNGTVGIAAEDAGNGQLHFKTLVSGTMRDVCLFILHCSGADGTAIDVWDNLGAMGSLGLKGYATGDGKMSGSDWTSTPDVISVGAYCTNTTERSFDGNIDTSDEYRDGAIASFSSYGTMFNGVQQPVVCAPGVNIVSSINHYCVDDLSSVSEELMWQGYPYSAESGTSMACPVVGGIVALWLQANPTLSLDDVKQVLRETSRNDNFTTADPERFGYGKIDAAQGIAYILDQATGISNMQPRDNHGTWYDLTGRSVTLPRRGIYIRNGRKYAF